MALSRNSLVVWSLGYPVPMSPHLSQIDLIHRSLSTFARIEAAETIGYVSSALCSETIGKSNSSSPNICLLYLSQDTSEASTKAILGLSLVITSAIAFASRKFSFRYFSALKTVLSISDGWTLTKAIFASSVWSLVLSASLLEGASFFESLTPSLISSGILSSLIDMPAMTSGPSTEPLGKLRRLLRLSPCVVHPADYFSNSIRLLRGRPLLYWEISIVWYFYPYNMGLVMFRACTEEQFIEGY